MHPPNVLCIICAPRISDPEPRKIFGVCDEGCGGARKKKEMWWWWWWWNDNRNVEVVKDGYELIDVNIVPPQVNRVAPHKKSPKRFLLYYLHL